MERIKVNDITYELQPSLSNGCEGCAGEDDNLLCEPLGDCCLTTECRNWREVKDVTSQ